MSRLPLKPPNLDFNAVDKERNVYQHDIDFLKSLLIRVATGELDKDSPEIRAFFPAPFTYADEVVKMDEKTLEALSEFKNSSKLLLEMVAEFRERHIRTLLTTEQIPYDIADIRSLSKATAELQRRYLVVPCKSSEGSGLKYNPTSITDCPTCHGLGQIWTKKADKHGA